jgi:hypothetical protein
MKEAKPAMEERPFDPLRTPYEIDEKDYPAEGSFEEQCVFLLRYSVLAPSGRNTQPWKFMIHKYGIAVYADYARRLPVVDPDNRELFMSIGALLMNLRIAAAHFGFDCRIEYHLGGDSERPVAFVNLTRPDLNEPDTDTDSLFHCIQKRHTNRNPFLRARVPDSARRLLTALDTGKNTSMFLSTDGTMNARVANLVAAADEEQQSHTEFRRELAQWIRPNWTRKPDGMTASSFGVNNITSALTPWVTKVLDLGKIRADKDKNLCVEAPGLIVLYGEDSIPVWLETGEQLQRLLLTIIREGMQYSFFNMPIQVPELRTMLRGLLGLSSWPQLLLRVGYCLIDPAATPRRPVEEVLMSPDGLTPDFHAL